MSDNFVCPTDGTYSEEHRWNCLARTVCRMGAEGGLTGKERREKFITLFGKKNGLKLGLKLETLVRQQWAILLEEKLNVTA